MDVARKYTSKDLNLMLIAMIIATFGSGIIWTGLPVLIADITGNPDDMGSLFLTSTISSIILSLFGGILADKWSKKKIALWNTVIYLPLMMVLFFFANAQNIWLFYVISLAVSLLGSLTSPSIGIWFSTVTAAVKSNLEQGFGRNAFYNMIAKMAGFGAGPLFFGKLGIYALLVDALAMMLVFLILLNVYYIRIEKVQKPSKANSLLIGRGGYRQLFKSGIWHSQYNYMIILSGLFGILSFPIINATLIMLDKKFHASEELISIFWLVASVGSVFTNFIISRGLVQPKRRFFLFWTANILMFSSFILVALAKSDVGVIAAFMLFTLSNPLINNIIGTAIFRLIPDEYRGRLGAINGLADSLFGLVALLIFRLYHEEFGLENFFFIASSFVVLRIFMGSILLKGIQTKNSNEN